MLINAHQSLSNGLLQVSINSIAHSREVTGTLVRTSKQAVVLTKADCLKQSLAFRKEVQLLSSNFNYFSKSYTLNCFNFLFKIRIHGDDISDSAISVSHARQSRQAAKIIYHPDFNETSLRNNVAVVIVRKHVDSIPYAYIH